MAVLLVLGYHAGLPFLPGGFVGVDVFFVISGFLITGLIDREIRETGRLNLARFWARRVRRLLPATAVVLAAVAVMTIVVLPVTRWASVAWDIGASALYVVNWRLADQSVSYLASEDAPSPVQHFWSLAVEEQFYVVWPLLLLCLLWWRRRSGRSSTRVMLLGIAAIGVPSLIWSAYATATDPGPAYFVSTTRLWELAVGAALAIVAYRLTALPRAVAHVLSLGGLAAIVLAAVTFDGATPFPGVAALLPTLGSAAVLAAGVGLRQGMGNRLLDIGPMRDIGTLSYSLYLWHWPLLIGATVLWGREDGTLGTAVAVMVVGFSVIPAWLTYRLVEAPIHHARVFARFPWRAAALGVGCTAVGLAAAVVVSLTVPKPPAYGVDADVPGAAALGEEPSDDSAAIPVDGVDLMVPSVLDAADDLPEVDGESCISPIGGTELGGCVYGPDDAEVTVAVVGDSKMHQWLPALVRIADERGWRLITYLKSACSFVRIDTWRDERANEECAVYNDRRYEAVLTDDSIDYVLTSQVASRAYADGDVSTSDQIEIMADELRSLWSDLEDAGREVIVVVDNPSPPFDQMECVATHEDDLGECAFPREKAEDGGGSRAQLAALEDSEGIAAVDLRDYVCPEGTCPSVIGNALVYRRGSHLTATYVDTLTPQLDEALMAAIRGE